MSSWFPMNCGVQQQARHIVIASVLTAVIKSRYTTISASGALFVMMATINVTTVPIALHFAMRAIAFARLFILSSFSTLLAGGCLDNVRKFVS